jgi:hypothetical protein
MDLVLTSMCRNCAIGAGSDQRSHPSYIASLLMVLVLEERAHTSVSQCANGVAINKRSLHRCSRVANRAGVDKGSRTGVAKVLMVLVC